MSTFQTSVPCEGDGEEASAEVLLFFTLPEANWQLLLTPAEQSPVPPCYQGWRKRAAGSFVGIMQTLPVL